MGGSDKFLLENLQFSLLPNNNDNDPFNSSGFLNIFVLFQLWRVKNKFNICFALFYQN